MLGNSQKEVVDKVMENPAMLRKVWWELGGVP